MEKWVEVAALIFQHAPISAVIDALTRNTNLNWPTFESQSELVKHVFHMRYKDQILMDSFPPSSKYMNALLKQLYANIESHDESCKESSEDVFADEFVEVVMKWKVSSSHMNENEDDDVAYITYLTPAPGISREEDTICGRLPVSIKVLRANNQVGARVWKASYYLTDLLLARPDLAVNKKVIELGSGVGNAMLTLAASSAAGQSCPRSIIVTDFDTTVLRLLQHNVRMNNHPVEGVHCPVHVRRLDWCTMTSEYARQLNFTLRDPPFDPSDAVSGSDDMFTTAPTGNIPETDTESIATSDVDPVDLILAADCTYSEDINVALVDAIEKVLTQSTMQRKLQTQSTSMSGSTCNSTDTSPVVDLNTSGQVSLPACMRQYPYALVVATQRQESTLQHFLDTITARLPMLRLEEVTQSLRPLVRDGRSMDRCSTFLHYDDSDIRVFCIQLGTPA